MIVVISTLKLVWTSILQLCEILPIFQRQNLNFCEVSKALDVVLYLDLALHICTTFSLMCLLCSSVFMIHDVCSLMLSPSQNSRIYSEIKVHAGGILTNMTTEHGGCNWIKLLKSVLFLHDWMFLWGLVGTGNNADEVDCFYCVVHCFLLLKSRRKHNKNP